MISSYGIKHVLTTPYKPSSNGCVERVNRTVGEFLKNITISAGTWDKGLSKAVMVYNNTKHAELNMSPAEFLLNKAHAITDVPLINHDELIKWKDGHPKYKPFALGQLVKNKRIVQGRGLNNKFKPRYEGPYEVIEVHDNGVTYRVKRVDDGQVTPAHHSQLVQWKATPMYLQYCNGRNYVDRNINCHSETSLKTYGSETSTSSTEEDYTYESIPWSRDSSVEFSGFVDKTTLRSKSITSRRLSSDFVADAFLRSSENCCSSSIGDTLGNFNIPDADGSPLASDQDFDVMTPPSGIVLPCEDHIWDMSSISDVNSNEVLVDKHAEGEDVKLKRVGELVQYMAFRLLDVACDRLLGIVGTDYSKQSSGSVTEFF